MDNQSGMHTYPFYSAQIVENYKLNCENKINELKKQIQFVKNSILKSDLQNEIKTSMTDCLAGVLQSSYQLFVGREYPFPTQKITDFFLELMMNCDDYSNWQLYISLKQADPDLARDIRANHIFLHDLLSVPPLQLQRFMIKLPHLFDLKTIATAFKFTDRELRLHLLKFCKKEIQIKIKNLLKGITKSDYDLAIKCQFQILNFVSRQIFNGELYVPDIDN